MMENYTIAEDFVLPSHGKVYLDRQVNENVRLRSMTTVDEMRRLSPNERQYKNMADVIDSCIVDDIGISAYDMCVADYQFLMHKLRVVTYGTEYPLRCTCPFCLVSQEEVLNLDELEYKEFSEEVLSSNDFVLPVTGKHIELRMQTPRLLDDITVATNAEKKRNKGDQSGSAFLFTLKYLIKTVDGEKLDPIKMEDFIKNLPMKDTNYIMRQAERVLDSMGLVDDLTIVCNTCGLTYTSPFRVTSEFFRPQA